MSRHSHLYQNAAWRKRRALHLVDEPLCRYCNEFYSKATPATIADHIERHDGDLEKFMTGALQSLCRSCHANVKQSEERTGSLKGARLDGAPCDPKHHWNQ